tara:strand:- start:13779 stop:14039 length:261 start_codon:yes stop_codon:yes gene_type:complete
MDNDSPNWMRSLVVNFVPAGVLTWALAILTAGYFGYAKNVDAAFISSIVTTVLATYGVSRIEEKKEKNKKELITSTNKKNEPLAKI